MDTSPSQKGHRALATERATIRLPDAAKLMRVSYPAALRLLLIGQIEGERDGRHWMVYVDSVHAAMEKRVNATAVSAVLPASKAVVRGIDEALGADLRTATLAVGRRTR